MLYNNIDRPIYALFTIKKDTILAKASKICEIDEFLLTVKNKLIEKAKTSPLS